VLQASSNGQMMAASVASFGTVGLTGLVGAPQGDEGPLVYGLYGSGGRLREFANNVGGSLLTDEPAPNGVSNWVDFSKQTLDNAARSGRSVYFDLTNMQDIKGVLAGTGKYADSITGNELRYIRDNWKTFQSIVTFYDDGNVVSAPWKQ
jgi:hypothetical protein